jgi:uncharacterized membrane protein
MQPSQERRRLGKDRKSYPTVRLYAKMMSWSSVAVLVVGIVLGVLMIVFDEQPLWIGSGNGFLVIAAGALYFIVARGVAEILYLLLDMARNSYTSRPAPAPTPSSAA